MFLRLKYEDATASAARGEINGKNVNFIMRVQVDELNIVEALAKFKGNKHVASFDYVGEPSFLKTIDIGNAIVIVSKDIEKLDMNVDFIMNDLDSRIRVVFKLPNDYTDMKAIYDYSAKYPNVRFCGGNLIRLEGCNIGCIGQADITKKIPDSRLSITSEGCACVMANIHIDDSDTVEFYEAKLTIEKKVRVPSDKRASSRPASPKKQLSSLLSLVGTGSMDNF
jgi:hypothetical protein